MRIFFKKQVAPQKNMQFCPIFQVQAVSFKEHALVDTRSTHQVFAMQALEWVPAVWRNWVIYTP